MIAGTRATDKTPGRITFRDADLGAFGLDRLQLQRVGQAAWRKRLGEFRPVRRRCARERQQRDEHPKQHP
ncbi:MAG: hypothetical protein EBT81_02295 [Gammaproteobacteria bacterium]|nr:hypothetical protein [Gammaproteobacteria bacterium]